MSDIKKIVIKGMNIKELELWCQSNNFPKYRAKQIYEWIYFHGIDNIDEMKNIPEDCKSILKQSCILSTLDMVSKSVSQSKKTIKYLFKTLDGNFIESVSMTDELQGISI